MKGKINSIYLNSTFDEFLTSRAKELNESKSMLINACINEVIEQLAIDDLARLMIQDYRQKQKYPL